MPVNVQNTLSHMKGQIISIEGREYKLDENGIFWGMPDEDARQLCERRGTPWRYYTERKPVTAAPLPVAPVALPPEPPPPVVPSEPVKAVEPTEGVGATVEKIPGEGEEWPDPVMSMSLEYLHKMAQAYQVKFSKNTPKPTLIKKITAAMYE